MRPTVMTVPAINEYTSLLTVDWALRLRGWVNRAFFNMRATAVTIVGSGLYENKGRVAL